MKKICCLTNISIPNPRQELITKALCENGWAVTVICWDRQGVLEKEEMIDGIRFVRVQPAHGVNQPVANNRQALISYWGDPTDRGIKTKLKLSGLWFGMFKKAIIQDAGVMACFHYAFLPLAVLVAKTRNMRVTYDVSEFNVDHALYWFPSRFHSIGKWLAHLEDMLVGQVSGVTCVPDRQRMIYNRISKICSNTEVILNVPELESRINSSLYCELKKRYAGRKVVVYAGALTQWKGIMEAVKAVKTIKKSHPHIMLLLIGSSIGDDTALITDYAGREGLYENIDILPFQSYENLHTYYLCADIGLMLPYRGAYEENVTIGNTRKNLDYIKASLPVIVPDLGDIGLLIRQEECGVIIPGCDAESISRAVLSLLDNPDIAEKMGRNGHNAFLKKYNWDIEKKKLLKVYQTV